MTGCPPNPPGRGGRRGGGPRWPRSTGAVVAVPGSANWEEQMEGKIGNKYKGGRDFSHKTRKREAKYLRGTYEAKVIKAGLADLDASVAELDLELLAEGEALADKLTRPCPTCGDMCLAWELDGISCRTVELDEEAAAPFGEVAWLTFS